MQVVVFGAHDAPRERLALSYTSRRDPPESGPKQTGPLMVAVFHRTTKDAAAKILQGGFRDTTSRRGYAYARKGRDCPMRCARGILGPISGSRESPSSAEEPSTCRVRVAAQNLGR